MELRRARRAGWALLAAALVVSGCTDGPAPGLDPDLKGTMTVAPTSAAPGQEVELSFPSDNQRGIAFSLSRWSEGRWDKEFYLTSDWGTPDDYAPTWWTVAESANRGWEQVAISGGGPDRVIVPRPPHPATTCCALPTPSTRRVHC
jgi:hypothetical protein